MEDGVFHDTPTGTPQGGVISPLLVNVALHGMEAALGVKHNARGRSQGSGQWCGTRTTSWCSARPRKTPSA